VDDLRLPASSISSQFQLPISVVVLGLLFTYWWIFASVMVAENCCWVFRLRHGCVLVIYSGAVHCGDDNTQLNVLCVLLANGPHLTRGYKLPS
jgi:hypothetical protein